MRARQRGPRYVVEPLAPPVIWIVYFMVVYLFAEGACVMGWATKRWAGLPGVSAVTVLVTLLACASIAYFTFRSWHRWRDGGAEQATGSQTRSLGLMGFLSGLLFLLATLSVGLPALLMRPC